MLLAMLLGAALSLLILAVVNGGLRWATPTDVANVNGSLMAVRRAQEGLSTDLTTVGSDLSGAQSRLATAESDLASLEADVSGLQTALGDVQGQMQALPALQSDLAAAQGQIGELQSQSEAVQAQVALVQGQVVTLTERVDLVAESAERSDKFLEGMRVLLASVFGEPISPTATITTSTAVTTTAPPTATLVFTPTGGLEATPPMTPTVVLTTTPAVTATVPVTATPAVTATVTVTTTETPTAPVESPSTTATPAPGIAQSAITGVVYLDTNRNGRRDSGEPGLPALRVTLRPPNQAQPRTVVTGADGRYAFDALPPGRYVVTQTPPTGFGSTTPRVVAVLVRGGTPATVDFGVYRLAP